MYRSSKFAFIAAASAMLATSAAAQPVIVQEVRSIRVSYADIRLDTNEGQKELRGLVRHAAKDLCGFYEWPAEISVVRHTCLRAVMRNADDQIEVATHRALADAHTGPKEIRLAVAF